MERLRIELVRADGKVQGGITLDAVHPNTAEFVMALLKSTVGTDVVIRAREIHVVERALGPARDLRLAV